MTANRRIYSLFVHEKIHLVNENQTPNSCCENGAFAGKTALWRGSKRISFRGTLWASVFMPGTCHRCFIWGCSSVPGIRELAPVQLFQQISIWTTGIPAPSCKGNTTIGDIDLLSICPIPRLGDILFNCMAKTEMEQEIMEDITPWSCAKSASSPSFPTMECWRIEGL